MTLLPMTITYYIIIINAILEGEANFNFSLFFNGLEEIKRYSTRIETSYIII